MQLYPVESHRTKHPYVCRGCGWAQRGGPIEETRPRNLVWFAPHEITKHDDTDESHDAMAIQAKLDGTGVVWVWSVSAIRDIGKADQREALIQELAGKFEENRAEPRVRAPWHRRDPPPSLVLLGDLGQMTTTPYV